ncbi:MAG: hypothetical protein U0872_00775 [Planctomycetaceae bacterium]
MTTLNELDPLKPIEGYPWPRSDTILAAKRGDTSLFQATVVTSAELADENLSNYRCIVFPNVPSVNESTLGKLTDAGSAQGTGLWLCLGSQTEPAEFNRRYYRSGGGLAPCPILPAEGDLVRREEFVTIHPPVQEHAATLLLSDTARLDIDRVKVYRHFPFVTGRSRTTLPVLLQSGTGTPLVVEGSLGRGRVVLQGLPLGIAWSNLPLTQAYVPLVHEWLWYLIQPTAVSRTLQPGEPLRVSLPANEHVRQVLLQPPHGTETALPPFFQNGRVQRKLDTRNFPSVFGEGSSRGKAGHDSTVSGGPGA